MGGRGSSGRAVGAELICGRGALTTLHAVLQARIACTHSPQPTAHTAHVKPRRGSYACATALRVTRAFRYGSGGSYGRPGVPGQPVRNTGRPTSAVAAVAASLKRFGWQQAIVADPKGVIVAGETRYKAAVSLGLTAAPVVTIPARQARAFRVIDNRTSELTSWDTDLLPDALAGLSDLDIFSFDDVLPLAVTAGKTDPDDAPEPPKNPVTRTGDIWVLGKHRISCGDSTDPETVERLLDGAEPDLMVTDPPYGVQYDSSWRYKAGIPLDQVRAVVHEVAPQAVVGGYPLRPFERVLGQPRFLAVLLGTLGVLTIVLTLVGVFGVVNHEAARRTREVGIRMSLGADAGRIRWMVLRRALGPAAVGVAAGLGASLWWTRTLQSLLFELSPQDPVTFGMTACLLLACVALASLIPAWTASRLDPAEALRAE